MNRPLTHAERGRLGGRALQDSRTPEQRRESMRRVRIANAIKTIEREADTLDAAQTSRIISRIIRMLAPSDGADDG